MSSIFEKYSSKINSEELAASQKEIQANATSTDRPEIPAGKYEVKVDNIEAKTSSKGNPMVSIQFRILAGKFEKSCIFYNGVFHEDWMRHRVAKMLSDLIADGDNTAVVNLILKGSLSEVNNFCMDVAEDISGKKLEYLLDYGVDKKGYRTYKIAEVYEA